MLNVKCKMENGKWKMENENVKCKIKCKMKNLKWEMESGKRKIYKIIQKVQKLQKICDSNLATFILASISSQLPDSANGKCGKITTIIATKKHQNADFIQSF